MQHLTARTWITAGVALAGASVISVAPVLAPLPRVQVSPLIQLISDEVDMTLDLVRHGQSQDNVDGIIGTTPPGAPLTAEGVTQAQSLANVANPQHLAAPGSYDGIFASEFIRTQETAQAWLAAAGAPATPVTDLAGLNEINAGILDGTHQTSTTGLLYLAAPLAWMFGQFWVPQLGSTIDPNGMEFETRFSDAVDAIYNAGGSLTNGQLTDVAFSHAASIATWTMMNVNNPDFSLMFKELETNGLLPNTGQIVIEGNPTDGWTLVSWDGTPVPAASLGTELFVDFRNLITAPQMAFYAIEQAVGTGDPTTITQALQTGFEQVGNAILQFPVSVYNDIVDALQTASSGAAAEMASAALAF